MKVVFFTPRPLSLAFGGQEVQLTRTRDALQRRGVDVRLGDPFDPELMNDVDLVHLFGSDYTYAQLVKLLGARGIPYVVSSVFYPVGRTRTVHTALARVPYSQSWLQRRVLSSARAVLPNSKAEAALLKRMFALPDSLLKPVPNGVDIDFVGKDPSMFVRTHLPGGWPQEEAFVLSVGRIEQRKNSLALLRAAKREGLRVVFVGQTVPAERAYATTFAHELNGYSGAHHVPFLPSGSADLANAYAAAHVHALVSDLETPGLASLEAALNGANIVYGDCPPVHEYLGSFGIPVAPRSVDDIALGLRVAVTRPRNASQQDALIRRRYTWDVVAERTLDVYREVLM
jgi:glycosyltransferase involved in cell wall biosynthesis